MPISSPTQNNSKPVTIVSPSSSISFSNKAENTPPVIGVSELNEVMRPLLKSITEGLKECSNTFVQYHEALKIVNNKLDRILLSQCSSANNDYQLNFIQHGILDIQQQVNLIYTIQKMHTEIITANQQQVHTSSLYDPFSKVRDYSAYAISPATFLQTPPSCTSPISDLQTDAGYENLQSAPEKYAYNPALSLVDTSSYESLPGPSGYKTPPSLQENPTNNEAFKVISMDSNPSKTSMLLKKLKRNVENSKCSSKSKRQKVDQDPTYKPSHPVIITTPSNFNDNK